MESKRGVSLIVLVVVIIVTVILLTLVISNMRKEDTSGSAYEEKLKESVTAINEELQNYITNKQKEYEAQGLVYEKEKLNANDKEIIYDNQPIEGNINTILPSIKKSNYISAFKIEAGVLALSNNYDFKSYEKEWINDVLK